MSRVRGLNDNDDFTFGRGKSDYKADNYAVAQNIQTRVLSFLGDCFFDLKAGVNWWNLLGENQRLKLEFDTRKAIIETPDVTSVTSVDITVEGRVVGINYKVDTIYGNLKEFLSYDLGEVLT